MVYKEHDYYVPGNAKEVRDRLRVYWTKKGISLPDGFSHMRAKQLYAIYRNIMEGGKSKSTQPGWAVTKKRKEQGKPEKTGNLEKEVQLTLFS